MCHRTIIKNKIAAILVTLFFLGGPVSADEIRLSNGDHLTGIVVGLGEDNLRMVTQSGEILIPRDKVASAFLGKKNPSKSPTGAKAGEKHFKNHVENRTPAHEPDTIADGIFEE